MTNYIIAVSGGVDSVVLLDMMAKYKQTNRLVVAHFDHGIRNDSAADARFVQELARGYQVPFEMRREELGAGASEQLARDRRYVFLNELAKKYDAKIVTAHHQNDLIETVAINLERGTGWRGLSVFTNTSVIRPLLTKQKTELYEYALTHHLEWVEDETNQTDEYLRNRLRKSVATLDPETISALLRLRYEQVYLRIQIENEGKRFITVQSRYFFTMVSENVALEILRRQTDANLTRPRLHAVLHAIKTARAGTVLSAGAGIKVQFTKTQFIFENTSQLLY
jgi:tRNA(Ile)-lysidine synthetase-like protein